MKTLKRLVATALLVLLASEAMANRVYRATKPYWWSQPAMKCHPPNDHGDYWCGAGAWQIGKLQGAGEDSLAAWGYAGFNPENDKVGVSIVTNFNHREVSFTCAGQTNPLRVQRERSSAHGASNLIFEYWTWASRARTETCLRKPLKMTVDGRTFRLGTKLLRQAVENAVDRATE